MTHKSVVVVVSSVWVLSAFIALLGLKWIQILGFISIQFHQRKNSGILRASFYCAIILATNHFQCQSHLKEKTVAELFKSSVQRQRRNDGS